MTKSIIFESLDLRNFKAFSGDHHVSLSGARSGITFVAGETEGRLGANGAGKSSMLDAIVWCIYGRTPRGLKGTGIRSWWNPKESIEVILHLQIDKAKVSIVRTNYPTDLKIHRGEHVFTATQQEVDDLIGLDYDAFMAGMFFAQLLPTFLDYSRPFRVEILARCVGVNIWAQMSDMAKKLSLDLERQHREAESVERKIQADLEYEQRMLKSKQEDLAEAKKKLGQIRNRNEEVSTKIDEALSRVNEKLKLQQEILRQEGAAKDAIQRIRSATASDLQEAGRVVADLQVKLDKVEASITEWEHQPTCPKCGQEVKDLEGMLLEYEEKAKVYRLNIEDWTKTKTYLAEKRREMGEKLEFQIEKIGELQADANAMNGRRLKLEAQKSSMTIMVDHEKDIEGDIKVINEEVRKYKANVTGLRTDLKDRHGQTAFLDKRKREIDYWVTGFKDIRISQLMSVIAILQTRINNYLSALGMSDWKFQFDMNHYGAQLVLDANVHRPGQNISIPWEACGSGGENQRLRLAASLGFADVVSILCGVKTNLEIWDEPSKSLSSEGITEFVSLLNQRAVEMGKNVFLVDHADVASELYVRRIIVKKDSHGRSTIY